MIRPELRYPAGQRLRVKLRPSAFCYVQVMGAHDVGFALGAGEARIVLADPRVSHIGRSPAFTHHQSRRRFHDALRLYHLWQ